MSVPIDRYLRVLSLLTQAMYWLAWIAFFLLALHGLKSHGLESISGMIRTVSVGVFAVASIGLAGFDVSRHVLAGSSIAFGSTSHVGIAIYVILSIEVGLLGYLSFGSVWCYFPLLWAAVGIYKLIGLAFHRY
jgi:hypothetical protein